MGNMNTGIDPLLSFYRVYNENVDPSNSVIWQTQLPQINGV
jgi:hypothetical protein